MLKGLRRKFIAIVMLLGGLILLGVLGGTYLSTRQSQHLLIEQSLERGLAGQYSSVQEQVDDSRLVDQSWVELFEQSGSSADNGNSDNRADIPPQHDSNSGNALSVNGMRDRVPSLVLVIDDEGTITEANSAPISIDNSEIAEVIDRVINGGTQAGYDTALHVAWLSEQVGADTCIAIVNTTASDDFLWNLATSNLRVACIALVMLLVLSWLLSGWALKPVRKAWEQQRRFVSDASHELKTPLSVILANVEILKSDEEIGDDARRWVDSTEEEAKRMKALVNDLLQLARSDENAADRTALIQRKDVDFSEMVEGSCLEFDAVAFECGCTLQSEIAEGVHVTGDAEWLERLVGILIDNACKYSARGETVTVQLVREGAHAHLRVHNMGSPIDEHDLPHVFDRFYRSDKARTREDGDEGGFGLGLAIAQSVVEAHGGSISVSSSADKGTTFTVLL